MKYAFDFSSFQEIAVFPHQSPDGDAIGSAVAMALYLKEIGKRAVICIDDEIQYELRFLCAYADFVSYEEALGLYQNWDFCVSVDCADKARLGRRAMFTEGKELLNIDHHHTNPLFGEYNIVDKNAPAACEVIYHMLKENGFTITKEIGEAIYTGLSTDTGNFLYDNVRPETFLVASELLRLGIDKAKIVFELYQNKRSEKIRLHADAINQITFHKGGSLAMTYVDDEMLLRNGASMLDTEGICESLRDIRGVEVACFLKEKREEDGSFSTKVSMRALPMHDVSSVASSFGGGGHKAAAGFTLEADKEKVKELLLQKFD